MSTSAILTMLAVQLMVSAITFYFIFLVLRKKRPENNSGSKEQF